MILRRPIGHHDGVRSKASRGTEARYPYAPRRCLVSGLQVRLLFSDPPVLSHLVPEAHDKTALGDLPWNLLGHPRDAVQRPVPLRVALPKVSVQPESLMRWRKAQS